MRTLPLWIAILVSPLAASAAEESQAKISLIGAAVWSRPAYNGAENNRPSLIPVISFYGTPWFARTTFGVFEGGLRTEVLSGLTLGGQLAYEGGRDSEESNFLSSRNLPTLNPGVSWGVHAELEKKLGPIPIIALLRYRQDTHSNRGEQTDFRLTAGIFSGGGLKAGIFAQTTWASKKSTHYYYGISAQQSASSGLAAFDAQSGELFNAYGLLWSYDIYPQWLLLGSFESRQVRNAAIDSPLVQQRVNRYASVGLAYQF